MGKRIWKYALEIIDRQTVSLPDGAKFLTVQTQGEALQLWALCDPGMPTSPHAIAVYGTGQSLPDEPGDYIATVQICSLVWHVFEVIPPIQESRP